MKEENEEYLDAAKKGDLIEIASLKGNKQNRKIKLDSFWK